MVPSLAHHPVFAVVANFAAAPQAYAGFDGRLLLTLANETVRHVDPIALAHAKQEWGIKAADIVRSIYVASPEAAHGSDFIGYDIGWFDPEHGQDSLILNYGLSQGSSSQSLNKHLLFDTVENAESLLLEWQLWQPEDGDKEIFENNESLGVLAIFDRPSVNDRSIATAAKGGN